jgi:hypothetical protein
MALQKQQALEQIDETFEHFHGCLLLHELLNEDEDRAVPVIAVATVLQTELEGDSR